MPFTTTAVSSRSPRYLGKITPLLGSPTWCPARPMRWRPRATEVGLSTWMTRSTAPMSMPSSRLLVATRAGRRPAFSSSSISRRCSLAMLPWWARTSSSPASSLRRWARRSARRRLLVNTMVLRWLADQLQDPGMDRRPDARAHLAADHRTAGLLVHRQDLAQARHVLDRDDDLDLQRLPRAGVDDRDLAAVADAAEEAGDGLERPLGGAEADALDRRGVRSAAGARGAPGSARDGRPAWCRRWRGPRR